jgi:hypothetical protein
MHLNFECAVLETAVSRRSNASGSHAVSHRLRHPLILSTVARLTLHTVLSDSGEQLWSVNGKCFKCQKNEISIFLLESVVCSIANNVKKT